MRKRPKQPSFNPSAECVALSQQRKKCSTNQKVKPASVSVVMLKEYSKPAPKGKKRQQLLSKERVKPVNLFRSMTALQVKKAILRAFQDHQVTTFTVLQSESGHNLKVANGQDIDGEMAIKRRGCLYLHEKCEVNGQCKLERYTCVQMDTPTVAFIMWQLLSYFLISNYSYYITNRVLWFSPVAVIQMSITSQQQHLVPGDSPYSQLLLLLIFCHGLTGF